MQIQNLNKEEKTFAKNLTQLVWGDLYSSKSEQLQKFIYDYTFEYYDTNPEFSFGIFEDELKGFILACLKNDCKKIHFDLDNLNKKDKFSFQELVDYVEFMSLETEKLMNEDDIFLGIFVSTKKGFGRILLQNLIQKAKQKNIKNIYLWTDSVCDFEYYDKNNFILEKKLNSFLDNKKIETMIYKKPI